MTSRFLAVALGIVVALIVGAGALYQWLVPGLSSARPEPGPVETEVATWLLHRSVPAEAKARTNPLANDPAEIAAGHDLFSQKCEPCHGYDGGGKTEIGSGQYPRPPALQSMDVSSMSDGEIFYHIRNGIRNTGMPAWQLPDRQIWKLVAYIRHLPHVAPLAAGPAGTAASIPPSAHYAGSALAKNATRDIYARWSKSRMAMWCAIRANILTPSSRPRNRSVVSFSKDDIAFVYGSRWAALFTKIGDDYFPEPAQWDVTHKVAALFRAEQCGLVGAVYPADNFKRPTGPLCDGCHSVRDIATKTVSEWNVGCERCHGAGSAHVAQPTRDNILNPARFNYVHANDVCIQCHS
jgi:mono/diheme cytochrome c family protein